MLRKLIDKIQGIAGLMIILGIPLLFIVGLLFQGIIMGTIAGFFEWLWSVISKF